MIARILCCLCLFAASCTQAQTNPTIESDSLLTAQRLSERALDSDLAYRLTESLTTEVGPRFAGTAQDERARDWAVSMFNELGFENVRVEQFEMDVWTRGNPSQEQVAIVSPFPQPLVATTLGGSAATPDGGLEAEVAYFASFDALQAFEDSVDALDGKIVYVNDRMVASITAEGYGPANRKRTMAWVEAEDRGAAGVLIRSVGTSNNRFPHTGMMRRPEGRTARIPAMALSNPDADQIERIHQRGKTMTIRMNTEAGWRGRATSGNLRRRKKSSSLAPTWIPGTTARVRWMTARALALSHQQPSRFSILTNARDAPSASCCSVPKKSVCWALAPMPKRALRTAHWPITSLDQKVILVHVRCGA